VHRGLTSSDEPTSTSARDSYEKIVVYADALLVVNGISSAEHTWPKRDWLTRENEPVLNPDLWQELVRLKKRAGRVEFRHVKAHKTNPYNRRVDKLAQESADLAWQGQVAPKKVARRRARAKPNREQFR